MRYVFVLMLSLLISTTAIPRNSDSKEVVLIDWDGPSKTLKNEYFGHNTVWVRGGLGVWEEQSRQVRENVHQLVQDLSPGVLRFPGGTRAMLYRFWESIGPASKRKAQCDPFSSKFDSTTWGPMEFFQWAKSLGAKVSLVTPWAFSTPQEVASFVAFLNGQAHDNRLIAGEFDLEDNNNRKWGRISDWASKRVKFGQANPFELDYVEISNEAFLDLKVKKKIENPCWCDERYPLDHCPSSFKANWQSNEKEGFHETTVANYIKNLKESSALIKRINPTIKIGAAAKMKIFSPFQTNNEIIDAIAPADKRAQSGMPWNRSLYELAGESFDFFSLHPYRILPFARLSLPQELEAVVKDFQKSFPDKKIAVTEFGFFKKGNTLANALVSAEMIKIAVEYNFEMLLRHILIEDQSDSLFASHGSILGPQNKKTPAYFALKLMKEHLYTNSFRVHNNADDLKLLATRSDDGEEVAILVINKNAKSRTIKINLPNWGAYNSEYHYLSYDRKLRQADSITEVIPRSLSLQTDLNGEGEFFIGALDLGILTLRKR